MSTTARRSAIVALRWGIVVDQKTGSVAAKDQHTLGEPALLLVESLIHEFIANGVLDQARALLVVAMAIETQVAHCDDRHEDPATSPSLAALTRIHSTLSIDHAGTDGDALPPDWLAMNEEAPSCR